MSTLQELLQDYLAMRRALGFKLRTVGTGLLSFVTFMDQAQAISISTDLALAWAKQPTSVQPARWAARLSYVRGFARYCSAIDPRTEIPPLGLLPFSSVRPLLQAFHRSPSCSLCRPRHKMPETHATFLKCDNTFARAQRLCAHGLFAPGVSLRRPPQLVPF